MRRGGGGKGGAKLHRKKPSKLQNLTPTKRTQR